MKNRIIDFFNRSDISRVNPCKKSIKLGMNYSYMRMTYKKAFKKFKEEHPTLQVSLSAFLNIKPEHIKRLSKTPFNACQCVYCTNVNLKLKVLNIPQISNEQDLYKILICKKNGKIKKS